MLFRNISIVDENFEVKSGVNVLVEEDRIAFIGENLPSDDRESFGDIIDGTGKLLIPGFVNAHGHSPMVLMRGYGENMSLQDWLFNRIFPFEDRLTSEAVYWGTLLSMAESLKFGIVSTSDMYYFCEDMVRAILDSGAKNNLSRSISKMDDSPFDEFKAVKELKALVSRYQGAGDGKLIIESSLHAEYTNNEDAAISLAQLAKDMGLRMHVHVSETKHEHQECKERHGGRTPVKYLSDCGIFNVPSLAAHCVWVEDEDIEILKEKNVFVVTNPVSNLKLASGVCDVKKLMDNGIIVALGTDSSASNNNLSIFEEMKTMSLLAKVKHKDPTVITPKEALAMATVNGALAQGRNDCGLVKEGYKADLVMINLDTPNMAPTHDLLSNLVLAGTDREIEMTMVDGKILYERGEFKTIDIEETLAKVKESVEDILNRGNIN